LRGGACTVEAWIEVGYFNLGAIPSKKFKQKLSC